MTDDLEPRIIAELVRMESQMANMKTKTGRDITPKAAAQWAVMAMASALYPESHEKRQRFLMAVEEARKANR